MFNVPLLRLLKLVPGLLILSSCSVTKQIARSAKEDVLDAKALQTAHVGISIYDPSTNNYLYNYQGDKYFVPASNTKIPTCYAAMKYLGDSLVGAKIYKHGQGLKVVPNGDPSFLHPDYPNQPLLQYLKRGDTTLKIVINLGGWETQPLGSGWAWSDYQESYMAERSAMPIYGNIITFSGTKDQMEIRPKAVVDNLLLDTLNAVSYLRDVERSRTGNAFKVKSGADKPNTIITTFDTFNGFILEKLLKEVVTSDVVVYNSPGEPPYNKLQFTSIKTQPLDSLLKPMMHRSDNFFAEQSLLMVSNNILGVMNDRRVVDTLLKTDFKDLPQRPRWADGSGLSRYNLFTPQDFVFILNKMKNEFGMERIKVILPTGGEGTISSYYKADSGYIFAKTGTLSGVVAFSGFLYTKKGKLLIFSTLVNNHQASATEVRRAVEKFLQGVRNKY